MPIGLLWAKKEIDIDKKKLYSVISTQQKTIDSQQKTIDRLTAKLVQELSEEPSKKSGKCRIIKLYPKG